MMKQCCFLLSLLASMQACSETTFDLSAATFKEQDTVLLKEAQYHKGLMYDRKDLVSYGINNNTRFSFGYYIPEHIELLGCNDLLTGYAFRICSYNDQEKVKEYLLQKFPGLKRMDSSKWGNTYQYSNSAIVIWLQTIPENNFSNKRNAYLDVKSRSLYNEIETLERKYRAKRSKK